MADTEEQRPVWTSQEERGGGETAGRSCRRGDEPLAPADLATWLWQRATSAATAVLVAGVVGLLLGPLVSFLAAVGAAAAVYGLGPVAAAIERRRWRRAPLTRRQLWWHWGTAAGLVIAAYGVGFGTGDVLLGLLALVLATPIASIAVLVSVAAGLDLPRNVGRPLAVVVPLGIVTYVGVEAGASVVDAALALALVAVVPLAVGLLEVGSRARRTGVELAFMLTGTVAASGLVVDRGRLAAVLAVPWVLLCTVAAVTAAGRWIDDRAERRASVPRPAVPRLAVPLAYGYLAFGSLWFAADRLALEPGGFGPPFVQLTAIHFTYAGFAAVALATRASDLRPGNRVASTALVAMAAGPVLVATGFAVAGVLQVVGALVLTIGTYALAWVTIRSVVPQAEDVAAWLLRASSISVLVPMLLAVQWAVGTNLGTPALSVPQMAATHGVANAVGFSLLGVLGWRRVRDEPAEHGGGER